MKTKSKRRLCWILLPIVMLGMIGCARGQETTDLPDTTETALTYQARIAELEAALERQRESQFVMENDYQARIAALEQLLERQDSQPSDGDVETIIFEYVVKDGCAVITGYTGNAKLLPIPATLDGYPVTVIGDRAFENSNIISAVLPDSLVEIGWFAFYGCAALRDVSIPASVTVIGYDAFSNCGSVTLICPADSYAERWARSYGIPCLHMGE